MKNWKSYVVGALVWSVAGTCYAAPQELDKVVTIVNNGAILQSDVATMLKTVELNAMQQNQQLPPISVLRKQVLDQLIMAQLQVEQAQRLGIQVSDQQVQQALANIAAQHNMTLPQMQQYFTENGVDYNVFRNQVKRQIEASEARTVEVRRRIQVLPQEVNALAKQIQSHSQQATEYNISHIQIMVEPQNNPTAADWAKAKAKADAIMAKLKQGANFAELAYADSQGPKALQGGEWGWMNKNAMPTMFANNITTQKAGDLIGPFRSAIGYHILRINAEKGANMVTEQEVNVRHILIKPSIILSNAAVKAKLEQIRQAIVSGKATFAQEAKQYSQDPVSAANGGNLGWQNPNMYVPRFRAEVEQLPIDKISQPFESQYGWHIVEVLGRRDVDATQDALKDRAYQILFSRKFNDEAQIWLQELRGSAFIENVGQNSAPQGQN